MPHRTEKIISFPACRKRKVECEFSGGEVTSDGGMVVIRGIDRRLGLTAQVAEVLGDPREPGKITHRAVDLVQQRIFGLAAGYEPEYFMKVADLGFFILGTPGVP